MTGMRKGRHAEVVYNHLVNLVEHRRRNSRVTSGMDDTFVRVNLLPGQRNVRRYSIIAARHALREQIGRSRAWTH